MAGVGYEYGFVLFRVGFGVRDVVDVAGIGAGEEGVEGRERELENLLFKFAGVFFVAEDEVESDVWVAVVIDIGVNGVIAGGVLSIR